MKVSFLAGLGPLVRDPEQSLRFYRDVLGLPLVGDGYMAADNWSGTRCFGQWTLEDVAESIFGTRAWPADIPVPQANLELDVESEEALAGVAANLRAAGYEPLVGPKKEPWNQSVVRGIGPEGFLVSTTYTPWLHESAPGPGAPATEGLGPGRNWARFAGSQPDPRRPHRVGDAYRWAMRSGTLWWRPVRNAEDSVVPMGTPC